MCAVTIQVPKEILMQLHMGQKEFEGYAKRLLALDLYSNKKVSLGYCASVAELTKEGFVQCLGTKVFPYFRLHQRMSSWRN